MYQPKGWAGPRTLLHSRYRRTVRPAARAWCAAQACARAWRTRMGRENSMSLSLVQSRALVGLQAAARDLRFLVSRMPTGNTESNSDATESNSGPLLVRPTAEVVARKAVSGDGIERSSGWLVSAAAVSRPVQHERLGTPHSRLPAGGYVCGETTSPIEADAAVGSQAA